MDFCPLTLRVCDSLGPKSDVDVILFNETGGDNISKELREKVRSIPTTKDEVLLRAFYLMELSFYYSIPSITTSESSAYAHGLFLFLSDYERSWAGLTKVIEYLDVLVEEAGLDHIEASVVTSANSWARTSTSIFKNKLLSMREIVRELRPQLRGEHLDLGRFSKCVLLILGSLPTNTKVEIVNSLLLISTQNPLRCNFDRWNGPK